MNEKRNVLFVGAHPDDVELGCGGTIAKHLELGHNVYVAVLTRGEQGFHAPDLAEGRAALAYLGIPSENIYFGNFPDGSVPQTRESVQFIEDVVKRHDITRIFTHTTRDRHQDHRAVSYAASSAGRNTAEVLLYRSPSTHTNFDPHYFIQLDDRHVQAKLGALGKYETQVQKGIVNLSAIEALAKVDGFNANHVSYAEAFELNHILRGGNDV